MDTLVSMSCGRDNRGQFHVQIECESSRTRIGRISLTAEQFAHMLTGCHVSDLKAEMSDNLDRVGKTKVWEKRSVVFPKDYVGDRSNKELFIEQTCQEPGWIVDSYLRSQSSVRYKDGETILNYSVYKFVTEE